MKTKQIKCLDCSKQLIIPFKGKTKRCKECARNERVRISSIHNGKVSRKKHSELRTAHTKVFMGIGEYADQPI